MRINTVENIHDIYFVYFKAYRLVYLYYFHNNVVRFDVSICNENTRVYLNVFDFSTVPKNYRKPRFMENLQAVLTEEGLVSFECKVVGFPTPVLSWFKDGQELKPGDVYQLTGTNSLGSYCCIARNCMGQASSSAELTVEDIQNQLNEEEKLQLFSKNQAPKFIQGLKSVEAKIDEPFRFTVKGTSSLDFFVFHNCLEMKRLTFLNVNCDAGTVSQLKKLFIYNFCGQFVKLLNSTNVNKVALYSM